MTSSPSELLCLEFKLSSANPERDSTSVVRVKPEPKMPPLIALKGDDPTVRGLLDDTGSFLRVPNAMLNSGFIVIRHAHMMAALISTVDQFAMEV